MNTAQQMRHFRAAFAIQAAEACGSHAKGGVLCTAVHWSWPNAHVAVAGKWRRFAVSLLMPLLFVDSTAFDASISMSFGSMLVDRTQALLVGAAVWSTAAGTPLSQCILQCITNNHHVLL